VQDVRRPVTITEDDITFPEPGMIRVRTHRTEATGDPLRTYFMRIVNPISANLTDVSAVAAAQIYDVCATNCVKPWSIPDRWADDNLNNQLDPGELYDPDLTGYNAPGDVGQQVVLKVGNPQGTVAPGQFYPVDLPPLDCTCGIDPQSGADEYRWNIFNCSPYTVSPGDHLQVKPGNMVGPTRQGVQLLIDSDPNAYWSSGDQSVMGSDFGLSPRVILVPFFDPSNPPESGRNYVDVVKIGAFFLESLNGSEVIGRFVKVNVPGAPCAGNEEGTFLTGIRLVE
jgi:hypothetical protein